MKAWASKRDSLSRVATQDTGTGRVERALVGFGLQVWKGGGGYTQETWARIHEKPIMP